ncbi:hypothetical protein V2K69_12805 [Pseudomonas alliivorans]|nr:hypothetical protein [Pseudomonas alliivorans]MEE4721548.1 hypothetical protein [Pseudomonas alliivorans]MEE4757672.1 hypothetical protein [Pseudomonas alliivorans]MEE4764313.1 hypothetical protein [Pseudomonas alliivorans]MEE4772794.1 hypothetical protein [Pseudomonas alliivorans]
MLAWLAFCRMSIGNRSFRAHGGNNAYVISQAQSLCARFAFIVSFSPPYGARTAFFIAVRGDLSGALHGLRDAEINPMGNMIWGALGLLPLLALFFLSWSELPKFQGKPPVRWRVWTSHVLSVLVLVELAVLLLLFYFQ